jgi:hypothetical protein
MSTQSEKDLETNPTSHQSKVLETRVNGWTAADQNRKPSPDQFAAEQRQNELEEGRCIC